MYSGAWQATVHGVAKSQTWLKRLSTHAHRGLTLLDLITYHKATVWYWDKDNYRAQWNRTESPEIYCDIYGQQMGERLVFFIKLCVCVFVYVLSTTSVFIRISTGRGTSRNIRHSGCNVGF